MPVMRIGLITWTAFAAIHGVLAVGVVLWTCERRTVCVALALYGKRVGLNVKHLVWRLTSIWIRVELPDKCRASTCRSRKGADMGAIDCRPNGTFCRPPNSILWPMICLSLMSLTNRNWKWIGNDGQVYGKSVAKYGRPNWLAQTGQQEPFRVVWLAHDSRGQTSCSHLTRPLCGRERNYKSWKTDIFKNMDNRNPMAMPVRAQRDRALSLCLCLSTVSHWCRLWQSVIRPDAN